MERESQLQCCKGGKAKRLYVKPAFLVEDRFPALMCQGSAPGPGPGGGFGPPPPPPSYFED